MIRLYRHILHTNNLPVGKEWTQLQEEHLW